MASARDNVEALRRYAGSVEIFGATSDNIIPIEHARELARQVARRPLYRDRRRAQRLVGQKSGEDYVSALRVSPVGREEGKCAMIVAISHATLVLEAITRGDRQAADELLPLVYEELRKLAASRMANEAAGNTLQPTALVHEAWLRLVGADNPKFVGRAHFFAAAAEAMRCILIDRARRKRALRHGGGQERLDIQQLDLASPHADDQLLAVNEALDRLAAQDPLEAELVKLRYFVGMTVDEAASLLEISPRTARNYWAHARTWLYREIMVRGS